MGGREAWGNEDLAGEKPGVMGIWRDKGGGKLTPLRGGAMEASSICSLDGFILMRMC